MHTTPAMAANGPGNLDVYRKSLDLVQAVYLLTRRFPMEEVYGLTSQMRRSAVSVPSNIAEGYGRDHRGDYLRFLSIARGSIFELETQVILAGRVGLLDQSEVASLLDQIHPIRRMLTRLISRLKESNQSPGPTQPELPPAP